VAAVVGEAVTSGRLIHLEYDGPGGSTERDVEPVGLIRGPSRWYLFGWCRLRDGVRGFRLDRIANAALRDEIPRPRDPAVLQKEVARFDLQPLAE
jgi:predicted DNA-binding transcriptional regulator YafY